MSDAHLDPLVHVVQGDPPDETVEARHRAGRAIRDVGHALVGHHAPVGLLDELSDTLEALAAKLLEGDVRSRSEIRRDAGTGVAPADGQLMTSYEERPFSGRASPWGVDLEVRRVGDAVEATVTLGAAHEGAPDRSHGGIVAGLIDDTYGFVLQLLGEMAFTGELAIRYEAGVPIGEPLVCRAELDRREGRKLFMRAVLTIGATGEVLVRSTATFIAVNPAALLAGLTT